MEILTMEDTQSSLLFLILIPLFLLFIIRKYTSTTSKNLPPGPRPWPIIGNMHQMAVNPHAATAKFAKKFGQLISLRLGTRLVVVASSPEAAREILKAQDRLTSGRSIPHSLQLDFIDYYFVWANDCNDHWRSLRTLSRTELFSVKAMEAQTSLRKKKLGEMLDFLDRTQGKAVRIEELVFTTLFNTLSTIIFSKDFLDLNDENGVAHGLKVGLLKILENSVAPNVSDFFPIVSGLDLQGLRKDNMKHLNAVNSYSESIIKERRARINASMMAKEEIEPKERDFLDRLLEKNFTNQQINILALELFIAGTDTVTTTVEWAMAELLKNKDIMSKLKEELSREIDYDSIMESDLSKLTYLNACIKETLRLHPVVPLLIPRRALQTCDIMNYTIPENTQIFINVWAINRDPNIWEDPLSFKPERFIGLDLDYKGQDFEFIPFGAGRRMCPGIPSGIKSLQSILASLILRFHWSLPNDEDPAKLDMSEKFGITLQMKKPLQLIFKPTTLVI